MVSTTPMGGSACLGNRVGGVVWYQSTRGSACKKGVGGSKKRVFLVQTRGDPKPPGLTRSRPHVSAIREGQKGFYSLFILHKMYLVYIMKLIGNKKSQVFKPGFFL